MVDTVTIGSMVFDAAGANGLIYTQLEGWLSSPPMRADPEDRPNGDGAFGVTKNYRSARVITFTGGLVGASLQDAEQNFFDRFAAIQSSGVPITFTVTKDWGSRSCTVSLMDVAEVNAEAGMALVAGVSAQFVAYDPLKYGTAVVTATGLPSSGGGLEYNLHSGGAGGALYYGSLGALGRVTVTNAGTADVWPTITVSGQLDSGFYVQCLETGDVLRYDRVVPLGTTVSLNAATGQVLIDGVSDGSTYLTIASWFSIPAGGSRTIQFNAIGASSGTPQMSVSAAPGYW